MGCGASADNTTNKKRGTGKNGPPPHDFDPDGDLSSISTQDNQHPEDLEHESSSMGKSRRGHQIDRRFERDEPNDFFVWDDLEIDFEMEKKHRAQIAMGANKNRAPTAGRKRRKPATGFAFNDFVVVDDFAEDIAAFQKDADVFDEDDLAESMSRSQDPNTVRNANRRMSLVPASAPVKPTEKTTKTTWIARQPGATAPPPNVPTRYPRDPTKSLKLRWFDTQTHVGHSSRVKCLAIAPGEREYVSCSNEDVNVNYCDVRTGQELGVFSGHRETVISCTFSHCGKYLATTSRDNTLMLWDIITQKAILTFEHARVVICCCFSRDSKYIATGCQDKVCRLWETRRGREVLSFVQHEGIIIAMDFSPDGKHIVSASSDKTLRMWMTANGRMKLLLSGHQSIILSCHFTNDGRRIVSNDDKVIKVWNLDASDYGQCLLSMSVDDTVKVRNLPPSRKLTWTLTCPAPGKYTKYFAAACNNRFLFFFDVDTGEEALSIYCKAPIYCLAPGFSNVLPCGDSFGNVYFVSVGECSADVLPDPLDPKVPRLTGSGGE